MAIIYNKNFNTHKYNLYSTDLNRERMKYRMPCRFFIFMSLCLYNVHEENIVSSTKFIEIVSRKLSEIENENNNNMQRKNIMNHLDETNESSISSKNNKSITLENKQYNNLSKNLTEKELYDVLKSLEEHPSKEDLINIWSHTLGVGKEGFVNVQKELKGFMQKYLDNDVIGSKNHMGESYVYDSLWKKNLFSLCETIAEQQMEYTKNFYSLINGEHTVDDILKFIYSFLEFFEALKKELHKKHQEELSKETTLASNLLKH
ncbi:Plasmodium exported protein (PHISTa), unknown function [Plasmodium sp. gorilla clade G2]|uniref:Plasmodium exported protein (PHISTa), unknown function n=1 Tax=Plasmodium sp. gorilla clade G2 TaxID=880535 RepID=UPI000D2CA4B3|nr:Plasmodium exported protein (PHISTa), unknown function [Plasmodium sp. gorilla clade G2]SOV20004.1 Plasmodium exported protein (PHISTa), unknown function [Plasmodium sp. gorilla clade G2]